MLMSYSGQRNHLSWKTWNLRRTCFARDSEKEKVASVKAQACGRTHCIAGFTGLHGQRETEKVALDQSRDGVE